MSRCPNLGVLTITYFVLDSEVDGRLSAGSNSPHHHISKNDISNPTRTHGPLFKTGTTFDSDEEDNLAGMALSDQRAKVREIITYIGLCTGCECCESVLYGYMGHYVGQWAIKLGQVSGLMGHSVNQWAIKLGKVSLLCGTMDYKAG